MDPSAINPTSDPQSLSPDTTATTQAIIFGVAACLLGVISIYLSYQQLRSLRLRRVGPHSTAGDIERLPRWQAGRISPFGNNTMDCEAYMLLSSELYTVQNRVIGARVSSSSPEMMFGSRALAG